MRFYLHKRRQTPTVIIVALIDVLIVMLIFLLVTTTFEQQPALKIALPESSQAQKTGSTDSPPLIVSIGPAGSLRFANGTKPVTVERFKRSVGHDAAKTHD